MPNASPTKPLLSEVVHEHGDIHTIQIHWQRWWLCAVFSVIGVLQSALWNFFVPISAVVEKLYGWSDYFVEWTSNVAGITFAVTVLAWARVVDGQNGIRRATVLACCALVVNSWLRIPHWSVGLPLESAMVVQAISNGLAGAPIALVPPVLSAAWFPVQERTSATGIMVTCNYLGQAVGFFLGPSVVPFRSSPDDPARQRLCDTNADCASLENLNVTTARERGAAIAMCASDGRCETVCALRPSPECDSMRENLRSLYWAQAAAAALCLCTVLVYFPSAAPTPPSRTALAADTGAGASNSGSDFVTGLRQLVSHRRFWVLLLAFGVPSGVLSGWSASLGENLKSLGFDQSNAGYIGAATLTAGVVAGIVVPALADRYSERSGKPPPLKTLIVVMYAGASASFLLFAMQCAKIDAIPRTLPWIFATAVFGGGCMNGTIPLFYELCVETTFPIGEGSTEAFLVLLQNVIQSAFLAVPPDNVGGTRWMNWCPSAAGFAFLLTLLPFEARYTRHAIDTARCGENDADAVRNG